MCSSESDKHLMFAKLLRERFADRRRGNKLELRSYIQLYTRAPPLDPQTNSQYSGVCNFVITTLHLRATLTIFSRFLRDVHISLAVNLPDVTYEQPVSHFDTRIIYPLSRKRNIATERMIAMNATALAILLCVDKGACV